MDDLFEDPDVWGGLDTVASDVDRARWAADPEAWVEERLGEVLWSGQRRAFRALRDHRKTAWASCHGVGKSYLAARAVAWWLDVHDAGDAFVVTTAPSQAQVRGVLWVREIARAKAAGALAGRLNQTEWWLPIAGPDGGAREELVAFGRKTADHDHTSFQGIHAPYVLVVGDESCGLDAALLDAMLTLASNDTSKILLVGNPDDPLSAFADAMTPGSGYATIHISAFETPNFTGEPVSPRVARSLVGRSYVEDFRRKWAPAWRWVDAVGADATFETGVKVVPPEGADEHDTHPWWQSKILGRFPRVDTSGSLIPLAWIRAAQARELTPDDRDIDLGLDVGASIDGDPTCLAIRRGACVRVKYEMREPDTMRSAGRAFRELRTTRGFDPGAPCRRGGPRLKVDYIGVGRGIVDRGKEAGLPVYPVTVSRRAHDARAYTNRLSEEWWKMRERFERGDIDLDPLDEQTAGELLLLRWEPDSAGRVKVTYANGPSPNRADAIMLACAEPDQETVDLDLVGGHMGLPAEKRTEAQLAADLGIDLEAEVRALEREDA